MRDAGIVLLANGWHTRAPPVTAQVAAALVAGLGMVQRLGKAAVGDKTLVDALEPFVLALGVLEGLDAPRSGNGKGRFMGTSLQPGSPAPWGHDGPAFPTPA